MSYHCYLHGWSDFNFSCPTCQQTITTDSISIAPDPLKVENTRLLAMIADRDAEVASLRVATIDAGIKDAEIAKLKAEANRQGADYTRLYLEVGQLVEAMKYLIRQIELLQAMAGHPSPEDACRNIIAQGNYAKDGVRKILLIDKVLRGT